MTGGHRLGTRLAQHRAGIHDLLEDSMTATRDQIEQLVMQVQADFLDTPRLALTPSSAAELFGVDATASRAVLAVLADANVLTTTRGGAYVRYFPLATHSTHRAALRARPRRGPGGSRQFARNAA
jgi:hypothetical protein